MFNRKAFFAIFFSVIVLFSLAKAQDDPNITVNELKGHIYFLAADSLLGRKPGTPQSYLVADYIRSEFKKNGLKLLGEDGFQPFEVVTDVEAGSGNSLTFGDFSGTLSKDFVPLAFSANKSVTAPVVFVGYGFDFDDDSLAWHDYEGVDVSGKWCLILRGDPEQESEKSPYLNYTSLRKKVLVARDHNAAGVLFVSGKKYDSKDELLDLYFDKSTSDAGISVLQIKRSVANSLLKKSGETIASLEKKLIDTKKPHSFSVDEEVSATTEIVKKISRAKNVVALLPGNDPVLKDEYIIVGAHYDHLGMGGPGSGSRRPDTIAVHNGADDNASGVAAVLEIAEKLASERKKMKRSIIAMTFDAEEMGTLGSKYFVNHPLVDLKKVKYMFNLDMVGRLRDEEKQSLTIGGTGTAIGLKDLVAEVAEKDKIGVKMSPEGYGPSDHANFYTHDIPVLFFFTGVHDDYHTPADDADKINYPGEKKVADYAADLIETVANEEKAMTFQEAGPKEQPKGRRRFKVTLGIVPDFAGVESGGLRIDMPVKGRPAALAGLKKGDIIIAMEGKPVKDIYDYMNRLNEFKPGQRISVEVLRDGKKEIFIVQL